MPDLEQLALAAIVIGLAEWLSSLLPAGSSGAVQEPPASRWWLAACAVVTATAMAVRIWSVVHIEGCGNEHIALARAYQHMDGPGDLAQLLHAPLHQLLLRPWLGFLDAHGIAPEHLWVRLPNIPLTGVLVLLLARLGRRLGVLWAGLATGVLYTASPMFLQLHANQENYLIEALGYVWFAERLAACCVQRLPVHRSLALAATFAFVAGYMSLPLLGGGALVWLATVAWRRDFRGLVRTLGWTLAIAGPLLGRLSAAIVGLISVSRASVSPAALNNQWHHEAMPMSQAYGSGRPSLLARHLLEATAGHRWPVVLGAALLALALCPPRALLAWVTVVLLFAAALIVPMHIQNLALLMLTLQFLACWGVELSVGRLAQTPWLQGRLKPAYLTIIALTAMSASVARSALQRWPLFRENDHFLPYREVRALRAWIASHPADMPVLFYSQRIPDIELAVLCQGSRTMRALISCVDGARAQDQESPWTLHTVVGRPIAIPSADLTSPSVPRPLVAGAEAFLATPIWARGFLTYRGFNAMQDITITQALDEALAPRCRIYARSQYTVLQQCATHAPP